MRGDLVVGAVWVVAAVVTVAACQSSGPASGPAGAPGFPDAPSRATVRALTGDDTGRTAIVRYDGATQDEAVRLDPPSVPASYAALVRPAFSEDCVEVSRDLRVSRFEGRALTIERPSDAPAAGARPGTGDSAAGTGTGWELCYARLFFDFPRARNPMGEAHHALDTVLSRLAVHRVPASVWLRGPASELLVSYRDPAPIQYAATHYGQPGLADSVPRVSALAGDLQDRFVLVKVVPQRYPSTVPRPIGRWGYFIVALHVERPDGTLAPLADFSSAVAP